MEQNLFAQNRIFVLSGILAKLDLEEVKLEKLIASVNQVIVVEEKLDKRSSFNKQLLANKKIKAEEFNLPHGAELNKWIEKRVKELDGTIDKPAVEELAVRLGRDEAKETKFGGKIVDVKEIYNLWQADGEINKLLMAGDGKQITKELVENLVSQNSEVDVFDIINSIGEKNKDRALGLISGFLETGTGSDEKGRIIQLNALLAEQFRNVLMVQSFGVEKTPEAEILEKTGWKSGRLFVIKKIASRFQPKMVLDLLTKLDSLDTELKTSSTPPRVLLDLITSQLLM